MPTDTPSAAPAGTQTLLRGLAVIQAVAAGARDLKGIAAHLGTTRSTTHRLVSALVEERYLRLTANNGYRLGPRLIELGFQARDELPLAVLAAPLLDELSASTGDTVHLAVRDGDQVLYLHKNPGRNGPEMRSRVGQRMPLTRTGIGKALLLDSPETEWRRLFDNQPPAAAVWADREEPGWEAFQARMLAYVDGQYAFDLEDNEPSIRCVAAPVRDASRQIVAAISVASTVPYMSLERMTLLAPTVQATALALSRELGG
ncbi:IclR family transcriptional regulator [Pseudomonas japonica]|uniref:IclR family transcriptional regulator n=1 Tax=Pseudomonas japonica TaxID=256466 RepID=UPI0015E3685F|nr:IclR family transcriptional regulator [Pseudomonas japonica]MBA1290436.1 IclR family transcriptional regulator [Pseudomonas japonica]